MAPSNKVLSHRRCIFTSCLIFCLLLLSFYAFSEQFSQSYYQARIYFSFTDESKSDDIGEIHYGVEIFDSYLSNTSEYILKYKPPARGEENILFLETSCAVNITGRMSLKIKLNAQQACAIESAAKANPNASIYLFYTCPLNNTDLSTSSQVVHRVFQYPNVYVWHESMESFFAGTPLEEFHRSGKMKLSNYQTSHASDVLRFLVLWKFGGIYLDLDFIVRRSLKDLGGNYACAEENNFVASGAMHFGTDSVGKHIADLCVEELRTNFRGDIWNHNGPALITRVLAKLCNVSKTSLMTRRACKGFIVFPTSFFYPIMYKWKLFYDENQSANTMKTMHTSHAVHLWNSLRIFHGYPNDSALLRFGSRQPILQLQQEFCPAVFHDYSVVQVGSSSASHCSLVVGLGPHLLSVICYYFVCIKKRLFF